MYFPLHERLAQLCVMCGGRLNVHDTWAMQRVLIHAALVGLPQPLQRLLFDASGTRPFVSVCGLPLPPGWRVVGTHGAALELHHALHGQHYLSPPAWAELHARQQWALPGGWVELEKLWSGYPLPLEQLPVPPGWKLTALVGPPAPAGDSGSLSEQVHYQLTDGQEHDIDRSLPQLLAWAWWTHGVRRRMDRLALAARLLLLPLGGLLAWWFWTS